MAKIFHNIGILAHVDSGKTTLTEQILYRAGALRSAGSVDSGTAATDNLAVEKERGISVRASTAFAEWKGVTFNIIDTPGHIDFAGEVERALLALDYAVVIVPAVEGVRAHTENIIHALESASLPYIIFINKTDRAGSDCGRVIKEVKALTKRSLLPLCRTEREGEQDVSVTELKGFELEKAATEALAEISDEAAELYLIDVTYPLERAIALVRESISNLKTVPVLCGSAKSGVGVDILLDNMAALMPSAERRASEELCGVIFKIEHDKSIGKISHVRLFGGEIANRDRVSLISPQDDKYKNPEGEGEDAVEIEEKPPVVEKVSQIRRFTGGKYTDMGQVGAGDIAALCGLPSAKAGQFVGSLGISEKYKLVTPFLRVRVTPADGDPEKIPPLAAALFELSDEEPLLDAKWENGQREITVSITGRIQTEIIDSLLIERYGIAASFSPPTVIYKETPSKAGIGYADYTMPKPCWAVVKFMLEPMPRGYGVSYHGKLPSNQCFYRYQTHIRTSFYQCLEQGLHGWEVTDLRCTLIGGEHHTIHTHPLDFFVCTPMAFMNGLQALGTTLLEPLLLSRISVPSNVVGKVTSELIRIQGEAESPVYFGDSAVIEAIIPAANSMDLPAKLAAWSSGRALISSSFYDYRECRDGQIHENPRRGVNPLDRSKWILWARGAYTLSIN